MTTETDNAALVQVPSYGRTWTNHKGSTSEVGSALVTLAAALEEMDGGPEELAACLELLAACPTATDAVATLADADYSTEDALTDARTPTRFAYVLVTATTAERSAEIVAAYLPANYQVTGIGPAPEGDRYRRVHLCGKDRAGWTLDGYVIPRLASGLYGCTEVTAEGTPLGCTGDYTTDAAGQPMIQHQGDTCPIHEAGE